MDSYQNKFEAVKIGISLSQQLITACIGLLTIIGGGVVYLVKVDNYNYFTFIPLGASVLTLLISIYFGYMGISIARNNGFRGWWTINAGRKDFNMQTLFCLIGILFFLFTTLVIFFNKEGKDKIEEKNKINLFLDSKDVSFELFLRLESFITGEYQLSEEMKTQLIKFITEIKNAKAVYVIGSADKREISGKLKKKIGSNFELSSLRAEAVKSFLLNHGVDSNIIITHVIGGCQNNSLEYYEDRNVTIYILRKNNNTPNKP
jgi:hypothetical protein